MFPNHRPRRLRNHPQLRRMVSETVLTTNDLIYPLFAVPGQGIAKEVASMPGVYQLSVDKIVEEAKEIYALGIPAIILFGIPEDKDAEATGAWHDCGIVQTAATAVKQAVPELIVIADTCLCEYTNHGHCGYLQLGDLTGHVLNDPTLELLKKVAVSQAKAGVDIIAPSGMMDGFVQAIRTALDAAGYQDIPILSYTAKYASSYYGPFRDAAESYQIRLNELGIIGEGAFFNCSMPRHLKLETHLSLEELKNRYQQASEGIEKTHYQTIWLLAQGKPTAIVAEVTGYSFSWIYELVRHLGPRWSWMAYQ